MKAVLKLTLILLAFASAFCLVEFLARAFLQKPENLAKLDSSSQFLFENNPGVSFPYVRPEFQHDVQINSTGFRDDEFKTEKSPGTYRIAVLGDSQEEALQVVLADTWQKVMAKKLTEDLKLNVETYNFGVSGYGTDQQWLTLSQKVWKFNPDMVILAFSPNDVGDTYKNKLVRIMNLKIEVISPKERAGGNFLGKIVRETYIYHLVVQASSKNKFTARAVQKVRTKILGFTAEERFYLSDAQLVQGPFEVIASQKNPPAEVISAWQTIKVLISDMNRQAEEHSSKFVITINIPRAQVSDENWRDISEQYKLATGLASPYEINEQLAKIAVELNIKLFDPREEAILWKESTGDLHYPLDGHFNVNGNHFMGTKVAEFIEKEKIIKDD